MFFSRILTFANLHAFCYNIFYMNRKNLEPCCIDKQLKSGFIKFQEMHEHLLGEDVVKNSPRVGIFFIGHCA